MIKYEKMKDIFQVNANKEQAVSMSKYMRNQFEFYGIPSPLRKQLCKDFLKDEKRSGQIDWYFLDACYKDEHREFQYLAIDYLKMFQKQLKYEDVNQIMQYVNQKQWWDTIDFLDRIIGNIGLQDHRIDDFMMELSLSDDIWKRRIAIDHQNGRKEKTNTKLLEAILCNCFGTSEFFVNKAIGWSLREYSKVNKEWVIQFVNRYKGKMNPLSIREASKYL